MEIGIEIGAILGFVGCVAIIAYVLTDFAQNKAKESVKNYINAFCERIPVEPGECRFNYKCHMNAAHEAMKGNDDHVAMVFYCRKGNDDSSIHFLNVVDGVYIDNTIGQFANYYDYDLVRLIPQSDVQAIEEIFKAFRLEIVGKWPLWVRLLTKYNV